MPGVGVSGTCTGAYRAAILSGVVTGLLAGDTIFSLRWAPTQANLRMAIRALRLQQQVITPFTAAQEVCTVVDVVRAFTAADSGGILSLPGAAPNNTLDSLVARATQLQDLRISNAGALVAGTRTIDGANLGGVLSAQLLAAASAAYAPAASWSYEPAAPARYVQVLNNQEGIIARNVVAFGAAGTVRYLVEVEWDEYAPN